MENYSVPCAIDQDIFRNSAVPRLRYEEHAWIIHAINALYAAGDDLVTTTVFCNDVDTEALIDTGAAITAVSKEFANRFPSLLCKWDGKTVPLADGMQVPSHCGLRLIV